MTGILPGGPVTDSAALLAIVYTGSAATGQPRCGVGVFFAPSPGQVAPKPDWWGLVDAPADTPAAEARAVKLAELALVRAGYALARLGAGWQRCESPPALYREVRMALVDWGARERRGRPRRNGGG